jgi:predicted Zn finger-like uncharacterized protein
MKIQCPECGASYRVDPARIQPGATSLKARCPRCNSVFSVPVSAADARSAPAPQAPAASAAVQPVVPPAAAPESRGKRVLVVDDSKFFRELIVDLLQPLELDCLLAADGVEALELMQDARPDLVMLDLNLPRMNGYELIAAIRSDAALKSTTVLAMSGVFRKETDVARVVQAGADDFINKSFKPEQLQERVRKLLKGR